MTGGTDPRSAPTAERYDARSGRWVAAGAPPAGAATTATLLRGGQVLVTAVPLTGPLHAGLYDPARGRWRPPTALPGGTAGLMGYTATRLPGGQVLLASGSSGPRGLRALSAPYDPATGRWATAAALPTPSLFHSATLLRDGSVFVAGGEDGVARVFARAALYR